uniref:Excreted/secreted protein 38 n=1 Tax=Leishmania major TaxID=5664 RepID=Q1G7I6_LEIMA|nr:excreted/secreted protein 38 [Leishmania major]
MLEPTGRRGGPRLPTPARVPVRVHWVAAVAGGWRWRCAACCAAGAVAAPAPARAPAPTCVCHGGGRPGVVAGMLRWVRGSLAAGEHTPSDAMVLNAMAWLRAPRSRGVGFPVLCACVWLPPPVPLRRARGRFPVRWCVRVRGPLSPATRRLPVKGVWVVGVGGWGSSAATGRRQRLACRGACGRAARGRPPSRGVDGGGGCGQRTCWKTALPRATPRGTGAVRTRCRAPLAWRIAPEQSKERSAEQGRWTKRSRGYACELAPPCVCAARPASPRCGRVCWRGAGAGSVPRTPRVTPSGPPNSGVESHRAVLWGAVAGGGEQGMHAGCRVWGGPGLRLAGFLAGLIRHARAPPRGYSHGGRRRFRPRSGAWMRPAWVGVCGPPGVCLALIAWRVSEEGARTGKKGLLDA